MNFKEAKKQANKIGGVVLWWCGYSVEKASEYNESHGLPKYVSKKAQVFFLKRHRKDMRARHQKLKAFIKQWKKSVKEKELLNPSEPHTVNPQPQT